MHPQQVGIVVGGDDDNDNDKATGLRPHPRLLDAQEREDEAVCQHTHHKQALSTINISLSILCAVQKAWNNGKEVPEIQKTSPSSTGRCK